MPNSPVCWTDTSQPVIVSFVTKSDWPILTSTDWDTIWSAVKAHTDPTQQGSSTSSSLARSHTASYDNGRFGWV